jgi:hypothetical protein
MLRRTVPAEQGDPGMRLRAKLHLAQFGWAFILAASAGSALAAPFCIENQALPPQCNYYDAAECQADAARQGGVCSANPQQLTLQSGIGQYCLATSYGASLCIYPDRGSCMADAVRQHGACTAAPNVAPGKAPDPYSAVGGL